MCIRDSFNHLPLQGNKGELITIKAKGIDITRILKAGVFLIPIGNDHYRVGATYSRNEKDDEPTEAALAELRTKLEKLINVPYEVIEQVAAVRPTVSDRRPLVGRHQDWPNVYVLNGLGSRGVLIAPYAARQLYDFIESGQSLDPDMDIARFSST